MVVVTSMSVNGATVPLADFLCGIHDVSSQNRRDAAHVAILAREVREMLEDADQENENVRSLLESCDAAERVALRLYRERPVRVEALLAPRGISAGA